MFPNNERSNLFQQQVECMKRKENFENVKHLIDQILSNISEKSSRKNLILMRKYFTSWKNSVTNEKQKIKYEGEMTNQKEKLDKFFKKIKRLKRQKNQSKVNVQPSENTEIKPNNSYKPQIKDYNIYKHRYKAQQNIITQQKIKLEKQTKLIEDLKLGKITEELSKSLETTKSEIREIFSKSSAKVKCKVSPLLEDLPKKLVDLQLRTEQAPKIIQQMEKRTAERALRRQMILERKKIMDEERKRMAELILEQKRVQDEEEKKRNLMAIKEKRRKEMELQKLRQLNKEKYLNNLNKALRYHNEKLKKHGLYAFVEILTVKHKNIEKSLQFYEMLIKKRSFFNWRNHRIETEKKTNEKADLFYRTKLLKKYINLFKSVRKCNILAFHYHVKKVSLLGAHR